MTMVSPSPRSRRARGFTLVELLVVIGILALLATLLLPGARTAKEAGRKAQCASNLHQLGMAMAMYLDDNGRYFRFQEPVGSDMLWWFGLESPFNAAAAPGARPIDLTRAKLYPYFQTLHGIEICPSFDYKSPVWRQKFTQVSYGYGYNMRGLQVNAAQGRAASDIVDPGRIICFADSAQVNTIQAPASPSNPLLEQFEYVDYGPSNDPQPKVHFRHRGTANLLFCDGHVASMKPYPGSIDPRLPSANVGRLSATTDTSLFLP